MSLTSGLPVLYALNIDVLAAVSSLKYHSTYICLCNGYILQDFVMRPIFQIFHGSSPSPCQALKEVQERPLTFFRLINVDLMALSVHDDHL